MTSEFNRISAASTAYVDSVCRAWGWSWQEMGQVDDDGVDGLVYLRITRVSEGRTKDSPCTDPQVSQLTSLLKTPIDTMFLTTSSA